MKSIVFGGGNNFWRRKYMEYFQQDFNIILTYLQNSCEDICVVVKNVLVIVNEYIQYFFF